MLKPRVLRSSLPTQPQDPGRVALARQWFPNRKNLCGGIVHHLSHKSRLSFCQNTQSACKCPHVILWPFQHKSIGCEKLYLSSHLCINIIPMTRQVTEGECGSSFPLQLNCQQIIITLPTDKTCKLYYCPDTRLRCLVKPRQYTQNKWVHMAWELCMILCR